MAPIFKNKTTLSRQNYMNLVAFHQKKNNWKYWLYTAAFSLLFIFCIAFQIVARNYVVVFLLFLCWAVFLGYRFMFPYYKTNKELKSNKIQKNLINYYLFYEKYFKVKNAIATTTLKYHKIYKAYENENYFYLYLDKSNAFIIEKSGFMIGDASSFEKFMKSKVKLKFKTSI